MSKKRQTSPQREIAAKQLRSKKREKWIFWGLTLPLTIVAAIALGAVVISDLGGDDASPLHTGAAPQTAGPTPAAWSYDPDMNRHWDPSHNHWHEGPPPAGVAPLAAQPVQGAPAAPAGPMEAWHYDEATNQHWDPGHNHWHPGPPPPLEERGAQVIPQAPPPQPDETPG